MKLFLHCWITEEDLEEGKERKKVWEEEEQSEMSGYILLEINSAKLLFKTASVRWPKYNSL